MGATSVNTAKGALPKAPPAILLTNDKPLDDLLLKPQVQGLGAHNGRLPMAAAGWAIASNCPGEQLDCVGASATLGGPDSRQAMLDQAGQIFASPFEPAAMIEEERVSPEAFFTAHTANSQCKGSPSWSWRTHGVCGWAAVEGVMVA
jgi:DEAD/DEAH box helicase domain-containing protein